MKLSTTTNSARFFLFTTFSDTRTQNLFWCTQSTQNVMVDQGNFAWSEFPHFYFKLRLLDLFDVGMPKAKKLKTKD